MIFIDSRAPTCDQSNTHRVPLQFRQAAGCATTHCRSWRLSSWSCAGRCLLSRCRTQRP